MPQPIQFTIVKLSELESVLIKYLNEEAGFSADMVEQSVKMLLWYTGHFKDVNMYVGIEFPYVDKVYRDVYYHYYATKLAAYKRNCIRLSFFDDFIEDSDFRKAVRFDHIGRLFKGFLIIRPTFPNIIGRSVLCPSLFQGSNSLRIFCCVTHFSVLVNGVKLEVAGFPHTSQDSEMMMCAEAAIWSMMEYFSKRYAEYLPVLPHEIHSMLSSRIVERQLPSRGLVAPDVSFVMKELGFGVKFYTKQPLGRIFYYILQCYVESGIPIMTSIIGKENEGHILNVIGRTEVLSADIDHLQLKTHTHETVSITGEPDKINLQWYDFYDLPSSLVMVDDNHPPYRIAPAGAPMLNYQNRKDWDTWKLGQINHLIVPLYKKVYMEVVAARELALATLTLLLKDGAAEPPLLRLFLASSRSFKNTIAANAVMNSELKDLLITAAHPRFVWIAEISTRELLKDFKVSGMIIIDATEPKATAKAIIACYYNNVYTSAIDIGKITLVNEPFTMYSRNATSF